MGETSGMVALCWIAAAFFALLALIDPRALWWTLSSWQYRNPEANEPSAAANALGRGVTAIMALGFGIAALVLTFQGDGPYDQARVDRLGQDAASELSGSYGKYGAPGQSTISEWVQDKAGDQVQVTVARSDIQPLGDGFQSPSRFTNRFELTSASDETARGCLTSSYVGGLFHDGPIDVSTDYSSGPC